MSRFVRFCDAFNLPIITLINTKGYDVTANAPAMYYDFASNQAAFVWNENLKPLCEKFTVNN